MGDRGKYLKLACRALENLSTTPLKTSSIYDTPPLGPLPQNRYLNMCVEMHSGLEPEELLNSTKTIEKSLGRIHRVKWGPREIDIDLLFYEDKIVQTQHLILPHPHIQNRLFVLAPLKEIAPDFIHPLIGLPVREILKGSFPKADIRKLPEIGELQETQYAIA